MNTIQFQNHECVVLENETARLFVTRSVGPRIIALHFKGGENLFAELPDFVTQRPDGTIYHFHGGHRLWHAPENMPRTYALDNAPVNITPVNNGLMVTQQVEAETGIEKSMQVSMVPGKPQIIIRHTLTNRGLWNITCAAWAITQLRPGGIAILPQSHEQTGLLPNRILALWRYTDIANPNVSWGNRQILVRARMQSAFKIGFPNPRGWLAYWLDGTLFVKRASFNAQAEYLDHGSSSECYCNDKFLELETLSPVGVIEPGASIEHTETWEVYGNIDLPSDEDKAQSIAEQIGLD